MAQYKHYLLDKIIFRMDYRGLFDENISTIIQLLNEPLRSMGFQKIEERLYNFGDAQTKVNYGLPPEEPSYINGIPQSLISHISIERTTSYIEFAKSFCYVQIDVKDGYTDISKYLDFFNSIISTIVENFPFFQLLRMGFRKINMCYVYDIKTLNQYFNKFAFNITDTTNKLGFYNCQYANLYNMMCLGEYNINYVRNILEGTINTKAGKSKQIYQIVLDTEVFSCDYSFLQEVKKNSIEGLLNEMDGIAHSCYEKSLTPKFSQKLQEEIFTDTKIGGIKSVNRIQAKVEE